MKLITLIDITPVLYNNSNCSCSNSKETFPFSFAAIQPTHPALENVIVTFSLPTPPLQFTFGGVDLSKKRTAKWNTLFDSQQFRPFVRSFVPRLCSFKVLTNTHPRLREPPPPPWLLLCLSNKFHTISPISLNNSLGCAARFVIVPANKPSRVTTIHSPASPGEEIESQ